MLASRPQSSSSQHQLPDLGFEDVDLDSPDASVGKTRSDQAQPGYRSQIMPIPFMQHASQDKAPPRQRQPDDFDLLDPVGADSPSIPAGPNTPYPFAPPVQTPPAAAVVPGSAVHLIMNEDQLQHGSDSSESTNGSSKAQALVGPQLEVPSAALGPGQSPEVPLAQGAGHMPEAPSAPGAGPFSTYSGPGSTSSSTPASPTAAPQPTRRSSFLPRGMSTHLHKALKATAAAASKASAAIAPPPNMPLPPSGSQGGVSAPPQQPAMSLPIPQGGQDQDFPFQQPWGPSGPASTGNQDRKEPGKPWWQQQLRNLQQNLHSPQALQPDSTSDSDADSDADNAPVTHAAMLNGLFQAQPVGENGDAAAPDDEHSPHDDQPAGPLLHPPASAPTSLNAEPPPKSSPPWSLHPAAQQHSVGPPDGKRQYRQQMDVDSMRIMESLGDADSESMSMSQDQQTVSLAAPNGDRVLRQAVKQQGQTNDTLLVSKDAGWPQVRPTGIASQDSLIIVNLLILVTMTSDYIRTVTNHEAFNVVQVRAITVLRPTSIASQHALYLLVKLMGD